MTRMTLEELGSASSMRLKMACRRWRTRRFQPLDLIISDFNMPEMTAWPAAAPCAAIRRAQGAVHPADRPWRQGAVSSKAAQAGVNNYLVQPFTADDSARQDRTGHRQIVRIAVAPRR